MPATLRLSLRTAALLSLGLASPLALAGKKKKNKKGAVEAPAAAKVAVPDTPADPASKKFAMRLLDASITDFRPSDAGGAKFVYSAFKFQGDNSWTADAYVEIDEERMECTESGKWTMEKAESDKVAVVSWSVDSTDCPGRESGSTPRVQFTISKSGDVSAEWR
jgi:hypothetical protein